MFVVAAFVLLAGLTVGFLTIPRMWLDGLLSGLEAIALIATVLALTGVIISTWGSAMMVAATVVFVAVFGSLPYFRRITAYRQEMAMARADADKWQKTIAFDPKNQGAHLFLARAHVKMGRLDPALKEYEEALRLSPGDPEARKEYNRTLQLQRSLTGQPWICPACAAENRGRLRQCFRCGAYMPRVAAPPPGLLRAFAAGVIGLTLVLALLWGMGWLDPTALLAGAVLLFAAFFAASSLRGMG